ncbi:MAG TPA: FG-GAP-like repeat-containing protein [Vicinamibacterales bacterium]|nr:FG-GAP-like repeat-containing protein [Vicinamibacterales bacterium]
MPKVLVCPAIRGWLLALGLVLGPLVCPLDASTVRVPGDFPTIQAAINAVLDGRLPDGTVIDVQPGTYFEALLVSGTAKSFTVRGIAGAGSTFVDASGRGAAVVNVFRSSGRIIFAGLTFRNGAPPTAAGGGFVIQEAAPWFVDCVFEGNRAIDGGGGALIRSKAWFIGSIIRSNSAARFGGGVLIVNGSRPVFTRSQIVGNASGTGGPGIGNTGAGGGVHSHDSSPTFRGCLIAGNSSKFAAGGVFHMGVFDSANGTAMLLVEDSTVADNVAAQFSPSENPSEGGGIHAEDNAVATLVRARVLRNRANTGGGLNAYRARYDIVDSVVEANEAAGGFGGGIAATSNNVAPSPVRPASVVNLTGSLVRNNTAASGGGIAVVGDYYCGGSTPTCRSIKASLSLATTAVDGNRSSNLGGGILLDRADLVAWSSLLVRNSVSGGTTPFGGGIVVSAGSAAIIDATTVAGNSAGQYGGAVFLDDGGSLTVTGSRLYDNSAGPNGGGGIFVGSSFGNTPSGRVENSIVADNASYQIVEHTCLRTTLFYLNDTITPRAGSSDIYFGGCPSDPSRGSGPITSISQFNASPSGRASGNNSNTPRFAQFLAAPGAGVPSALAWSVARATSVSVSGVGTFTQQTAAVDVAPGSSATYSLTASTATGGIGPVTASVVAAVGWGAQTDTPVPADYDGDGRADVAVFRPSTGEWFIAQSGGGARREQWGAAALGDVPVPADYDGDGRADIAVYRGSTGEWFIAQSRAGGRRDQWGAPMLGDVPVPADYDGDGRADIAVYRGSTGEWFIAQSGGGARRDQWGAPSLGDVPVPADYDGDGRADIAVARAVTGQWFVARSRSGFLLAAWGFGDARVPADFDGDGARNIAIWTAVRGEWFIR